MAVARSVGSIPPTGEPGHPCRAPTPLQALEVPGYRQKGVADLLVYTARRGVSGVPSGLDHRHLHPGVFEPVEREPGQGGPDAAALVVRVDGQHGDLTHAALGIVELDGHEADCARTLLGDPHPPLFRGASVLHRPALIFSPVRMLSPEDLGT